MPMAPASLRAGVNGSRPTENIVHVGTSATAARGFTNHGQSENHARAINFNGTKVEPLHSVSRGDSIPIRNAALTKSAPVGAFRGDTRDGVGGENRALASRGATGLHGGNEFHGPSSQMRTSSFNNMRAANAATFRSGSSFGNHATFGSHGSYHGSTATFGGSFHGGSAAGGGFSGGGFHGASSSSGFHGGGRGFPRRWWFLWRWRRGRTRWRRRRWWRRWRWPSLIQHCKSKSEDRRANRRFSHLCAFCMQSTKDRSHRLQRNGFRPHRQVQSGIYNRFLDIGAIRNLGIF